MSTMTATHERQGFLGGSDGAVALGLSPYITPHTLWLEKTGQLHPWEGNDATRAGSLFERGVLDHAEQQLGPLARQVRLFAEDVPFPLATTLDGLVIDSGEPVEAKTTGLVGPVYGDWGDEGTDQVPTYYLVQVLLGLYCSNAELAHLFALIAGRGVVQYQIVRSDDVIRTIVDRLAAWWEQHIVRGIEPERNTPVPLDIIKRLKREPEKVIPLDEHALALTDAWEQTKAAKKIAIAHEEAAKSELLLLLGDAEAGDLPDGRRLTYQEQINKGYTVAPFKCRVARIKKGE